MDVKSKRRQDFKDRCRTDRKGNQRCGNYDSVEEPEYAVVDDQEEVQIFPARPIYDEREYADRDPPRSSSSSALFPGNSNILRRESPLASGPAINRDLKPGRGKARINKRPAPAPPGDQLSPRCFSSRPSLTVELVNHLPGLTLHEPCRRDGKRTTKAAEFSPRARGLQKTESFSSLNNNQRHSLDLETHDIETRAHRNLERVSSKRHHHEWPQTKEDIDQHDFVPMGKPQQTYCEEDWYVGACSRVDAEHALHLVNKDGAFLVRDCSMNTNSEPLVLAVYHDKKVFNVKIRFIDSMSKYVLGTRQRSNDMFDSVADIVKFHTIFPITLISGRNIPGSRYPENCVLTCPITKRDLDQLLK